jgi:hypothetical protein
MRLVITLIVIGSVATQAAESSWTKVAALKPGEVVRVHTPSTQYEGTLLSVSDHEIMLRGSAADPVTVRRVDVEQVYVRGRSHRLRNTIIGSAIGIGIGAVIFGTLGSWFRNEGVENTEYMLVAPIAIGTGIGAALPSGGMKKIYDARP